MAAHKFDIEDKKKEIREDLNRLAKILGRSPTSKDYKQQNNGKWSYTQILYLYGNWNVAVKDAGLNPNPSQAPPKPEIITKDELAKEFIIISNTLGKIPSMREFGAASKYSTRPYTNSFGKWIDAVNYMTDNYLDKFSFPMIHQGLFLQIAKLERSSSGTVLFYMSLQTSLRLLRCLFACQIFLVLKLKKLKQLSQMLF